MATALKVLGYNGIRQWVSIGAIVGMLSSLLVFQYGQARIWFAMSRDGLLPKMFSKVHPVHKTPHISTWIAGLARIGGSFARGLTSAANSYAP
ncbi:MAG: amino acid permease [Candidatus Solibacter sp.]|nr:amino acid permease [Candidatus Solibacter sp.]